MSLTFQNEAEAERLKTLLSDQEWRLNNLYWIEDKQGNRVRYRMNKAQLKFYRKKHKKKCILKARQLGLSTHMAMYTLDMCLFTQDFHAIITDKKQSEGEKKIAKAFKAFDLLDWVPPDATEKDKALAEIGREIKRRALSYDKEKGPDKKLHATQSKLTFANGSWFEANTSGRGDTVRLLWVSELGYIAHHDPIRAHEIRNGAFPAAEAGMIVVESTHEGGKNGDNYDIIQAAMSMIGQPLTRYDWMFFFFGWFYNDEYKLELETPIPLDERTRQYFARVEANTPGLKLTDAQKNWWVKQYATYRENMFQEYPSVPEEALEPHANGTVFGDEVSLLRQLGRFGVEFEVDPYAPIYTSWDLGTSDYTSIWWWQPGRDGKMRALDCYIANGKGVEHYISVMARKNAELGHRCDCVYLPHDGSRRDFHLDSYATIMRRAGYRVIEVPRTNNKKLSLEHTRALLRTCIIHRRCMVPTRLDDMLAKDAYPSGTESLIFYRYAGPGANGVEPNEPLHDKYSHGCDAVRQFADAVFLGLVAQENGWHEDHESSRERRNPERAIGLELLD